MFWSSSHGRQDGKESWNFSQQLAHQPQKGSDAAPHLTKQCTKDAATATMQCHINAEDNDLDFLQS
jgi:hypothetical protein